MKLPLLLSCAGLILAGCANLADEEGPISDTPTPFSGASAQQVCSSYGVIDRDNNGVISQAEWGGFRSGVFADWDRDDDNRLTRAEFQNCWEAGGFRTDTGFEDDWDDNFGAFDDDADTYLTDTEFFGDDEFGEWDEDDDFGLELGAGEWGF